jgi:hypothetical protein
LQETSFRKLLLNSRRSDGIIAKSKIVLRNRIVDQLLEYGAINESLEVDLDKVPSTMRGEMVSQARCLHAPLSRDVNPIPPFGNEGVSVNCLQDLGYLYIEAYGDQHDFVALFVLKMAIEAAYNAEVRYIGKEEQVEYDGQLWSNVYAIVRQGEVIGLILRVKNAEDDIEQIRVRMRNEKMLVQYDINDSVVRIKIHCPHWVKTKAMTSFKSSEEKFSQVRDVLPTSRVKDKTHPTKKRA